MKGIISEVFDISTNNPTEWAQKSPAQCQYSGTNQGRKRHHRHTRSQVPVEGVKNDCALATPRVRTRSPESAHSQARKCALSDTHKTTHLHAPFFAFQHPPKIKTDKTATQICMFDAENGKNRLLYNFFIVTLHTKYIHARIKHL